MTRGQEAGGGPEYGLAAKGRWQLSSVVGAGLEFYWEGEALRHFDPSIDQHYFLFPTLDLSVSPQWELNLGVGHCPTWDGEHWVVKAIVGRRLGF